MQTLRKEEGYNCQHWTPTTSMTSIFCPESSTSLSLILSSIDVSPFLVPFTLNLTITSLCYTEDMGPLGSELFNTIEKILNHLVRPLQCLLLSCPAPLPVGSPPSLSSPAHAVVLERQYWAPLFRLQIDLAQVTAPEQTCRQCVWHQGHSRLPTSPPTFSVPCLSEAFQGPLPGVPTSPSLCPSLPRPEKGGTATGVDAVCLHLPDPMGPKLDSERERLFWELSHETLGVTQMGSFILDRHSLCIN
ncbi:hypothetical protein HPG69_014724, partial [Diceros bicornis minor]